MSEVLRYAIVGVIVIVVFAFGIAAAMHVLLDPVRRCRHLGPVEVDMTGERVTLRCCACDKLIIGPPNRWRSAAKR